MLQTTWPRGVTVSTLDSESSDRGSNPREAFGTSWLVRIHGSPRGGRAGRLREQKGRRRGGGGVRKVGAAPAAPSRSPRCSSPSLPARVCEVLPRHAAADGEGAANVRPSPALGSIFRGPLAKTEPPTRYCPRGRPPAGRTEASFSSNHLPRTMDSILRSYSKSGVAQWLACWAHNPKVRGSKPHSASSLLGVETCLEGRPVQDFIAVLCPNVGPRCASWRIAAKERPRGPMAMLRAAAQWWRAGLAPRSKESRRLFQSPSPRPGGQAGQGTPGTAAAAPGSKRPRGSLAAGSGAAWGRRAGRSPTENHVLGGGGSRSDARGPRECRDKGPAPSMGQAKCRGGWRAPAPPPPFQGRASQRPGRAIDPPSPSRLPNFTWKIHCFSLSPIYFSALGAQARLNSF